MPALHVSIASTMFNSPAFCSLFLRKLINTNKNVSVKSNYPCHSPDVMIFLLHVQVPSPLPSPYKQQHIVGTLNVSVLCITLHVGHADKTMNVNRIIALK